MRAAECRPRLPGTIACATLLMACSGGQGRAVEKTDSGAACDERSALRGFVVKKQHPAGVLSIRHVRHVANMESELVALCPGDRLRAGDHHHLEIRAQKRTTLRVYRVVGEAVTLVESVEVAANAEARIPTKGGMVFSGDPVGESFVVVASTGQSTELSSSLEAVLAGRVGSGLSPAPDMAKDSAFRTRGQVVVLATPPSVAASLDPTGLAVVPLWLTTDKSSGRGLGIGGTGRTSQTQKTHGRGVPNDERSQQTRTGAGALPSSGALPASEAVPAPREPPAPVEANLTPFHCTSATDRSGSVVCFRARGLCQAARTERGESLFGECEPKARAACFAAQRKGVREERCHGSMPSCQGQREAVRRGKGAKAPTSCEWTM